MRSYRLEIARGSIVVKAQSRKGAILQAAQVYSRAALDLRLDTFLPAVVRVREGRRTHAYPMEKFLAQVLSLAEKAPARPLPPLPPLSSCRTCDHHDQVEARCMAPRRPRAPLLAGSCGYSRIVHLTPLEREVLR